MNEFQKKLWIGLIILGVLSPVGIILPLKCNAGDAWGEWSVETLKQKLGGSVPERLEKSSDLWKAPVPDYNLGDENAPLRIQLFSYIASALGCVAGAYLITRLLTKFTRKKE